ncbi:ABC transporter ATP-binding protein [Leptospira ognonensis]|uniref:ABC transporter ATP-binding protein n=1 Tax=Leptospira ognonensis TaxID=2484945 RepID=A0A4R9K201_9LEPT|nr:ABC transporter ATP-binding protein [Leptospira ognonensis]TGL59753.1 ABC transporter ATP-binding protein [Leptospira ognonensis]
MKFEQIVKLWNYLSPRRKKQYIILLIFMMFTSIVEVFSIGSVVPFLAAITSPEILFNDARFVPLLKNLNINKPSELLLPATLIFMVASLLSGATRLFLSYATNMLSVVTGAEMSKEIYQKTLYQPFAVHNNRNSSEVISGIMGKSNNVISYVLQPILTVLSSFFIISAILASLMLMEPYVTIGSFSMFGFMYIYIAYRTKRKLVSNGEVINKNLTYIYKSLQEGLGGIREVILDGSQKFYIELYSQSDLPYRKAMADNSYLSSKPRYIMEAFGMAAMAIFAYVSAVNTNSILAIVPILGSLALGAQKLLPIFQQVYASWANVKGAEKIMDDVLGLLGQKMPETSDSDGNQKKLKFENLIEVKDLNFRYNSELPPILTNFNLKIEKGSRVGIIGKTGAGKSTLVDIIMGLLEPESGKILIDGVALDAQNLRPWQRNLAHVPQSIFLADTSILENIALGIPKGQIDIDKIKLAARQAQIGEFVESLPDGYNTYVGERGVRLSGGQKQRIGIARALYKEASVIVFDEATSALDNETEQAVMEAINQLDKSLTIIIIAHRLSTIENCDNIVSLT